MISKTIQLNKSKPTTGNPLQCLQLWRRILWNDRNNSIHVENHILGPNRSSQQIGRRQFKKISQHFYENSGFFKIRSLKLPFQVIFILCVTQTFFCSSGKSCPLFCPICYSLWSNADLYYTVFRICTLT